MSFDELLHSEKLHSPPQEGWKPEMEMRFYILSLVQ